MKKWMIGVALMGFTTLGVAAQEVKKTMPSPEERAQKMTDRMTEKLSLNEAQKKQIYAINLENATNRQKEMEAQKAERDAKQAEMKAQEEKIKSVLTDEQKKQWEELKTEGRDRRRPGGEVHDRSEIRRGPRGGNK